MMTIGQIVRQRREALGLTLAALAQAVGATKGYLSMIENHRVENPPSPQLLEALEQALAIDGGQLTKAAAWQSTPAAVKRRFEEVADAARQGQELARWLKDAAGKRKDGARSLDQLYRSGELSRRVNPLLGESAKRKAGSGAGGRRGAARREMGDAIGVLYRVPLINKVSAGYPRDFTDLDYPRAIADESVSVPDITDPDAFAARVVGDSMLPDYREGDIVVFSPAADVKDGNDCFVRLEPDHETTFKRVFFEPMDRIRIQPLNAKYPPQVLEREQVAGLYRAVWRVSPLP